MSWLLYANSDLSTEALSAKVLRHKMQNPATKEFIKDETYRLELHVNKSTFLTNLIQFLVIIDSVIGILTFMLHK